jgi:predicted dinucleotide-binding enzyme
MRIGIIGAGNVGGALGKGWARAGHQVVFGVRDARADKVQKVVREAPGGRAASVQEAAAHGEVIVLTTPWGEATQAALRAAGDLRGKALLDCTNPLKPDLSGLALGHTTSAAEQVAAWAPGARVVKIFNTTGANNMEAPDYDGLAATMFYAGDDQDAKTMAGMLASDLGFEPVDAGPLANARLLEHLAMLWIYLAYPGGLGREIAFKLLRR